MAACCGKSQSKPELEEHEAEAAYGVGENPQTELPLQRVHAVLDRMSAPSVSKESADGENAAEEADAALLRQSGQIKEAVRIAADMWGRERLPWPAAAAGLRACEEEEAAAGVAAAARALAGEEAPGASASPCGRARSLRASSCVTTPLRKPATENLPSCTMAPGG